MKKAVAEKVLKILQKEVVDFCDNVDAKGKVICDKYGLEHTPMDRMFNLSVEESESDKGWFGIRFATDSTLYDMFFDYGAASEVNLEKLTVAVNKQMGKKFKDEEHYFEHYGGGVLTFY